MSLQQTETGLLQDSRSRRVTTLLGRYCLTWIPFVQVGLFLANVPGPDERAMLAFFLPPVAASLFLIADNGRFDKTGVRAAWLLLSVAAFASLAAEIDLLPIKPQFPALPARVDRVLVYYLAGWYSYVLIVCPAWFVHWRLVGGGRSQGTVGGPFIVGCATWAIFVGTFAILAARKLC